MRSAPVRSRSTSWWIAVLVILGGGIVARNLTALGSVPPGLYLDEASIGYNAWSIAFHRVDEHGHAWPLYFEAFGEYKSPVYVYALVPIVRLLPLTSTTERLPAALFGLVAVLLITLAAWRITRSRWIALVTCTLAALTPWLVQESRVGFEVISMVAALTCALWCLAGEQRLTYQRFAAAGCFLALSVFAYSTARLEVALLTGAFAAVYARRRFRGWWLTPAVVLAAYAALGAWALAHPGALTAEFNLRNIAVDGAPVPTLIGRFAANYISYFSPEFLLLSGDPNPRHNTGHAGMLLWAALPLLLLGVAGCWRRRREALPKFVVLGLILGPAAAALVNNGGEPHALRSSVMLPFWLLLAVFGLDAARALRRGPAAFQATLAVALAAGLLIQATFYLLDMYTAYPVRAAPWFDTGLTSAIAAAARHAAGHQIFVSATFEGGAAYIDADFALLPPPPSKPVPPPGNVELTRLHVTVTDPGQIAAAARPGDVLVLAPWDPAPAGATRLHTEYGPADPLVARTPAQPLAKVYELAASG